MGNAKEKLALVTLTVGKMQHNVKYVFRSEVVRKYQSRGYGVSVI